MHGARAYAVGGCVRDSLMGKTPSDWDITCSCSPEKTLEIFEAEGIRTIPTGLKHGTVSVIIDGEVFECTTHRVDGSYTDSRRPDSVQFTQRLEDDLSRRDFTVNAMAANPSGEIFDAFGGMSDLDSRIIRCVGDPKTRFTEDALRILRALRFATVLDFEIEGDTLCAARLLSHTLENISAERKTVELVKLLCSPHADRGVSLLFESGAIKYLLPDAENMPTNLLILEGLPAHRLAALMWQTNSRDLSLLRLSNSQKSDVKSLLTPITQADTDEGARRALARYKHLAIAAAKLQSRDLLAEKIAEQAALDPPVSVRDLAVGGDDLLALGVEKRLLGGMLSYLLDCVFTDPSFNTKERLLSLAKEKFSV